jgi:hypothetical protein
VKLAQAPLPSAPIAAGPAAKAAAPANTGAAHASRAAASPSSHESLSPESKADLDAAESALASGKADEAMHLARRALTAQKSSRAFAVIVRIYCKQGDLGNAKASLRSVAAGERAVVVRACEKDGIDLK